MFFLFNRALAETEDTVPVQYKKIDYGTKVSIFLYNDAVPAQYKKMDYGTKQCSGSTSFSRIRIHIVTEETDPARIREA